MVQVDTNIKQTFHLEYRNRKILPMAGFFFIFPFRNESQQTISLFDLAFELERIESER
jgi:hypothetical protein